MKNTIDKIDFKIRLLKSINDLDTSLMGEDYKNTLTHDVRCLKIALNEFVLSILKSFTK